MKIALPRLYVHTRQSVLHAVRSIEYYSATTDLWSSANSNPCMSYTMHYISKEWELSTFALNAIHFHQDYNGENLADAKIKDTLQAWELDSKNQVVCLTTDNGSNIL